MFGTQELVTPYLGTTVFLVVAVFFLIWTLYVERTRRKAKRSLVADAWKAFVWVIVEEGPLVFREVRRWLRKSSRSGADRRLIIRAVANFVLCAFFLIAFFLIIAKESWYLAVLDEGLRQTFDLPNNQVSAKYLITGALALTSLIGLIFTARKSMDVIGGD